MQTRPVSIRAEHLAKSYALYARPGDRLKQFLFRGRRKFYREFWALKDVSFELARGEVLGVIGRNGAGKSTLLQLVCGTLTPTRGTIEVHGRVAALLELGAGFNPDFTGRENVFMNAALLGAPEREVRERFDEIVAFSGIGAFIDQPVKTYSSGMFVRLAFSVATAFEPDILVIDEALSVGDGEFARKSFERIMALKERGATILFCSHALYHVDALCERALWLERGEVRMLDAAHRVTAAYNEFLAQAARPDSVDFCHAASPATAAGTTRFTQIDAQVDGQRQFPLAVHSRASCIEIEIGFASDPALPCPTVAWGLENEAGIGISSGISLAAPEAVTRQPDGAGGVRLRLPQLPLLKGRYYLTLFLVCERGLHVYDTAPRCLTLEVSQNDHLQGLVALPHEWLPLP